MKQYCQLMAQYNKWMNDKIYAVCADLSDEARRKDQGAFFKSIHGTLNHILWGDRNWMRHFKVQAHPIIPLGQDVCADFTTMRAERAATDAQIIQWASSIDEEWFKGTISFESIAYKKTIVIPAIVAVTQLFNHQTHHRGQLTTLLSQLKIDYGPTDLPLMPGAGEFK